LYSCFSIIKPKSILKAENTVMLLKLPHIGAIKQLCSCFSITKPTLMLKAENTAMLFKLLDLRAIKQSCNSSSIVIRPMLKPGNIAMISKPQHISAAHIADRTSLVTLAGAECAPSEA
jgi:hypothetical protein